MPPRQCARRIKLSRVSSNRATVVAVMAELVGRLEVFENLTPSLILLAHCRGGHSSMMIRSKKSGAYSLYKPGRRSSFLPVPGKSRNKSRGLLMAFPYSIFAALPSPNWAKILSLGSSIRMLRSERYRIFGRRCSPVLFQRAFPKFSSRFETPPGVFASASRHCEKNPAFCQ